MKLASTIDTSTVTDEQIGMCHKVYEGSTPVWMVQSESDELKEYKVKHSKKHGFTCTCKAGQNAFSNCKLGYCKHVAWALAASKEERAAIAELQTAIAVQAAMSDPDTIKRAEVARETPTKVKRDRTTAPIERKAFSILR